MTGTLDVLCCWLEPWEVCWWEMQVASVTGPGELCGLRVQQEG